MILIETPAHKIFWIVILCKLSWNKIYWAKRTLLDLHPCILNTSKGSIDHFNSDCHQWPAIQANISPWAAISNIIIVWDVLLWNQKMSKNAQMALNFNFEMFRTEQLTISKISSLSTGMNTLSPACAYACLFAGCIHQKIKLNKIKLNNFVMQQISIRLPGNDNGYSRGRGEICNQEENLTSTL